MTRKFSFKEILEAAAKPHPQLWDSDGRLNLGAVERYYEAKGHPVSQATLWRLCKAQYQPGPGTVEATHKVFGVPKDLVRGESVSAEMDELLANYRLSTLLLAKKLESLPRDDYQLIVEQVERALAKDQQLKQAIEAASNVSPIDRARRKT